MSVGVRVAPAGAVALTVPGGVSQAFGAWVEFVASSTGAIHAAGFVVGSGSTFSASWDEMQIATGAGGAEVVQMLWKIYGPNSGNSHPRTHFFPVPMYLGPAGTRVAIRMRDGLNLKFLYHTDLVSDHETTVALAAKPSGLTVPPTIDPGVSVTPNATAWAWSSWVEVAASFASEVGIVSAAISNPVAAEVEWELGVGAVGAEVGITRIRATSPNINAGSLRAYHLPGAYPVAAGTRIAARLRKSGTSVTVHRLLINYVDGTGLL